MIRIAIVGCGYWGPNLIRNFFSLSDCNVTKICDVDSERLSHLKALYPTVETTQEFNEVTGDPKIDAVVIATPVRFHFEMTKAALKAGKHTFVEKPMASSVAQCKKLIEIAEDKSLTLMVGHTFVYSTPVRRIKEIIDSGDLGQIQYIRSQRLNLGLFQKDINVAWDLAPHDISIVLYIMEELPVSVNCQGKAHVNRDVEDVTNMTLNFDDGAMAIIQSSWLDPNKVRQITVVGNKKMLVYDDLEPIEKIRIYDKRVEIPPHYDTFAEFQYAYHYGDMHSPYLKMVEPLKVEGQHFLDCIKSGTKPLSSGYDGLQVIQVLEASSNSLKRGGAEVMVSHQK
jgi:predicted dehydrogenase